MCRYCQNTFKMLSLDLKLYFAIIIRRLSIQKDVHFYCRKQNIFVTQIIDNNAQI